MAVSPGFDFPKPRSRPISLTTKSASSCSLSATWPVMISPVPASDHKFFSFRPSLFEITAFAAFKIFWVER